jgi:arylsulfatase A-like enzyme
MNTKNILAFAILLVAIGMQAQETKKSSKTNKKPNIVFILADDMGYNELGSYGGKIIETPNIDQLAKEGMKFSNHYSGSNICAPSRGTLMTGKHTGHAYIRDNRALPYEGNEPIPASEITVAEILKSAGYTTGVFGKWGLGYPASEGSPNNQGFDQFYGYNGQIHAHNYFTPYLRKNDLVELNANMEVPYSVYSADLIKDKALEFVEANKSKPFFLYFSPTLPHNPYHQPDDKTLEYYAKKTGFPIGDAHSEDFSVPKYAALSSRLDQQVGEIVAKLKELNLLDDTLIIFASDNGSALTKEQDSYLRTGGDLRGRKSEVYEGGIKSPLIAFWKGKIIPGSSSNHISAFWDFLPTCAEIVKVKAPDNIDGISYLPTLLGKTDKQIQHDYLYWERSQSQAIRKGDIKANFVYDKASQKQNIEIYNLVQDPFEKNNLAETMPELKAEFVKIAQTARVESEIFPLVKKAKKAKVKTH